MKGLIAGIKRMEIHDGEGLRTTVFFKGCPLRCLWCHNPETLSFSKQVAFFHEKCIGCGFCQGKRTERAAENCPANALWAYGKEYEPAELAEILYADAPFFRNGGGVTLSGGECLAQPAFAVALAKCLFARGISVFVDTCGYVPRGVLEAILPYTDRFLYDIKAIDRETHIRCTGKDNTLIFENLRYLCESGCRVEIRYPLVMGENDGECEAIAAFLQTLPQIERVKVLRYHALSASRYEALGLACTLPTRQTTVEDVERAVALLRQHGLRAINGAVES